MTYVANGKENIISVEREFFSSPLLDFIKFYKPVAPSYVIDAVNNLEYRNHISVHITVDKKLFDDNWIYVHSPGLKMARIADFTNFSDEMSKSGEYPLTLEYFCFENENIWKQDNKEIVDFALKELRSIFKE